MVLGLRNRLAVAAFSVSAVLGGVSHAFAAPVSLTGNYLEVGISDYGTFGSDGNVEPGILHDPTGKQNFGVNDYLTPGSPHDGFAINSDQTGMVTNDNYGTSGFGSGSPTIATVPGYTLAATWTGGIPSTLSITNTYFFNPGDEQIKIVSTITALANLTNLSFGRSEDPDPDVYTDGDYSTVNTRGDSTTAPQDLVSAAGQSTGLTIGILNTSGSKYVHNTEISTFCCYNDDPNNVLANADTSADFPNTNLGDYGLQMAWEIGTLNAGETAEIDYSYVFGTNQSVVSAPPSTVPLPASLPMFAAALLALAGLSYGVKHSQRIA